MVDMRGPAALGLMLLGLACNGASAGNQRASEVQEVAPVRSLPTKPRPQGTPQSTLPKGLVEFEDEAPRAPLLTVKVEVADTDEERQMGLMFREELGADEGMVFLFPDQRIHNFWMRNTLLPLDMFFIDSDWKVVGVVENAEPLTEISRGVDKPSQYVLEVNAGFARRHGFGAGHQLRFVAPGEKP